MGNEVKSPKVRLVDIAQDVGVSIAAASHVLNGTAHGEVRVGDATRKRIEEAAVRLGYRANRAAQQLRGVRTGLIVYCSTEVGQSPSRVWHAWRRKEANEGSGS